LADESPAPIKAQTLRGPAKGSLKEPRDQALRGLRAHDGAPFLPPVRLPSRFKLAMFQKASAGRGARPAALKAIDKQIAALAATREPMEGFAALQELQTVVDSFISKYPKRNDRRMAATALKNWVDGAVKLREKYFKRDS